MPYKKPETPGKTGSRTKKNFTTAAGNKVRLTYKQKKLEDLALSGMSRTQAAMKAYNTTDYKTAGAIASQNLKIASVQVYREEHIAKASAKIVQMIDSENETISLKSSQDVLDRSIGKATQKVEQHTTVTEVSNDQVTNAAQLAAQFVMFLKQANAPIENDRVRGPVIDD